jgi:predicted glycosyltransferase involved in capsule biosynthesis
MISNGNLDLIDLDADFTPLCVSNAQSVIPCSLITADKVGGLSVQRCKEIFPKRKDTCFSGGIMGICKYSMDLLNGWDERFRGRGWEDYAFTAKIELFLYSTHTYVYSALHLWHPYEINTTKLINEKLNREYEQYDFYDYFDLIHSYIEFGSPIKYAISTTCKSDKSDKNKKNISDCRYYYAKKFFNKLFKKYKNNRSVYLHLCDQLQQINDAQIKESGHKHC